MTFRSHFISVVWNSNDCSWSFVDKDK